VPLPPEVQALAAALDGQYAVEREIGRGGMGIVYLARDLKLDRPVAIKVLPPQLAGDPDVRERFLREAKTAGRLSHPNIVPVFRADEAGGQAFFVMAFVDGESLGDRIRAHAPLVSGDFVHQLRDVALALGYAHAQGIVHRDIKPENILLERGSGRVLVTDFGIARIANAAPITATGQVLGSVHYMSPEQISGEPVDGKSDIYSLGVVAFHGLTGRLPFDNLMASAVLVAHVTKPAPTTRSVAPHVPEPLAEVVDRCLAKAPDDRFATAGALADALARAWEATKDAAGQSPAPARISTSKAEAVWRRAAELDAAGSTSGYPTSDVRAAAIEAGLGERHVAKAMAEVRRPAAPPTGAAELLFGGPTRIFFEAEVDGEVSAEDYDLCVEIARRMLGDVGRADTVGRSLTWSSVAQQRQVQFSILPRHGKTSIYVEERLGQLAGGLFGGIMGGGGGGIGGPLAGWAAGGTHVGLAIATIGAALAGAYGIARIIFTRMARHRRAELQDLIERLRRQVEDSIRRSGRLASPRRRLEP